MQRRDVAEADERPWIAPDCVVVESVEDPHRAVAAAREEDGVDLVIPQRPVQLLRPDVVGAREISAVALLDVWGDGDPKPPRLAPPCRALDPLAFRGTRRRQDRDVRAGFEGAGKGERHGGEMIARVE